MNSRHPNHRRVRRQGASRGRCTVSGDKSGKPGKPGKSGEFQIAPKCCVYQQLLTSWRSGAMFFFDFLRDVSDEMISVGSIFGWGPARNASNTYRSRETSFQKSKKHCAIFKFSSRLRETRLCLEKSCLVHAKR